jgi:hypothetical protein
MSAQQQFVPGAILSTMRLDRIGSPWQDGEISLKIARDPVDQSKCRGPKQTLRWLFMVTLDLHTNDGNP